MGLGLLWDADGQPASLAGLPGPTQAPQTLAAQSTKVNARCGVHALPFVGARGMRNGQPSKDRAQQGLHAITAMTQPQLDKVRHHGTWHLARFAPEVAEVLADEGSRYGRRRHPVRAQAGRATRPAKRATLPAHSAQQHHSRTAHPRANAQGALQQLVARAAKLRIAAGGARTLVARALPLPVQEDAPTEAAHLEGGSVLQTALTPAPAPTERVHDRYKALAAVADALRTGTTGPLAVRPLFLRRADRPRAQAFVVLLAYQRIHSLASCGSPLDGTGAAGLHALTTLCLVEGSPTQAPSDHCLPIPRDAIAP